MPLQSVTQAAYAASVCEGGGSDAWSISGLIENPVDVFVSAVLRAASCQQGISFRDNAPILIGLKDSLHGKV